PSSYNRPLRVDLAPETAYSIGVSNRVKAAIVREWLARGAGGVCPDKAGAGIPGELQLHPQLAGADVRRDEAGPAGTRAARLRAGSVTQALQAMRDQRSLPWVDDFLADARIGWRTLGRSPGFVAVAVLTLALGIGATTAMFTVGDRLLF